ncbi:MAG: prolipoprotein diacylglyceryl transferase [Bacillaceae bacterium]|nr:prolipoprotein diacylglyceryl transferase [Bacillaceae bacterium]
MFLEVIDPIAFQLGPLKVHWYGIILGTAALVGLWLAIREGKRVGIDPEIWMDLLLYAVPVAIIGARTYYVIFQWDYYAANPGDIIAIWKGGLAIHGALIGAILTTIIFARVKKISFWRLTDVAAPSIILGQAIGRWGNFVNQEAHGGPVTLDYLESLNLPQFIIDQMYINGVYYHPTFLYESIWNLMGFLVLIGLRRLPWLRRGELFLSYFIWYSMGRFVIEGMRTDSLMFGDIRVAQAISILLIVLSLILIIVRRWRGWARARYGEGDQVQP